MAQTMKQPFTKPAVLSFVYKFFFLKYKYPNSAVLNRWGGRTMNRSGTDDSKTGPEPSEPGPVTVLCILGP